MSRSATVILAWMMVSRSLSVTEAMTELARLRPVTRPNNGFIRQLRLFEAMGCTVDAASSRYRYFAILHGSIPRIPLAPVSIQAGEMKMKCRKCRCVVASQQQVLPHSTGRSPDWCPQEQGADTNISKACKLGIFIVDVDRLLPNLLIEQDTFLDITQKFNCSQCNHKIGNYGMAQCPCGAGLIKSIWINFSRVDKTIHS